jgi:hypothetical protein
MLMRYSNTVAAAGGDISGEIVLSLGWEHDVDLDMHVTTPDGNEIYYADMRHDHGELDVDCTSAPCRGAAPVENIVFTPSDTERILRGTYVIDINVYSRTGHSGPISATLSVKAGGCMRVFELSDLSGRSNIYNLQYGGVDAPGTTGMMSRMSLARQAANAVLETLTEADYAGIVAFDGCVMRYSEVMVRVTDDERLRMQHWISNLMPGSTTDYAHAFESAFEVLRNSEDLLGCANSTALIFLTDGRPDEWSTNNWRAFVI